MEDFLRPYHELFIRKEPRQTLERYVTGLLSDLPRKNGETIGAWLEGVNYHRIYSFLVTSRWDERTLESI
ncbi:transposase [Melghirimyces profundicolus]|uniref:transposase n=1 Tax=Melghirimyces profundicolus TaxID=1242148 RepID=UPI00147654BF|nr:transposase [Melghirimyces profundicolus]